MRIINGTYYGDGKNDLTVYCLSTDTKPTDGVATGSIAIEVDTGIVYFYDEDGEEGEEWVAQFSFQPAED